MADLTGMMQAAAGAAGGEGAFIEDVFSCFLYTGTGAAQTITNGIDLTGEGGLTWFKCRSDARSNLLFDSARGDDERLISDSTSQSSPQAAGSHPTFTSTGFTLGADTSGDINFSPRTYVSWTFRKAPKFFDIVTYTGTGANRTVAHNLGSVPGSIWVKRTSASGNWQVYHRANTAAPETDFLVLNDTAATADSNTRWNDTLPTDTVFTVGTEATVNASGGTYVAYLFAHDDGGFGDDGTENVITCGTFTTDGSGNFSVNLGYEPQWVMIKSTNNAGVSAAQQNWIMMDNMRGFITQSGNGLRLRANTSEAESTTNDFGVTATGFQSLGNMSASAPFIFIAIRRGPMKTPTAGTEVYNGIARTGTGAAVTVTGVGFAPDLLWIANRGSIATKAINFDRLRGGTRALITLNTSAELAWAAGPLLQDGYLNSGTSDAEFNASGTLYIDNFFRRAPGYFDVVCYTGTGSATTFAHNLGVVPELMIMKKRSATDDWAVYAGDNTDFLQLNTTAATADDNTYWNDTSPTSTVFSVGTNADVNTSAATYVAYLFASVAGVSDIGTYTGNGTSVTVTTGFQPRFVLVKRTDSTGNWIYGDSARGLVAGNDPALFLNTSAAETTGQDWVDVSATGFTVNETALNANVSTASYLYFVIS